MELEYIGIRCQMGMFPCTELNTYVDKNISVIPTGFGSHTIFNQALINLHEGR